MSLIKLTCPECGATLEIGSDKDFFFCQYCGTKLTIPRKAIRYEYVTRDDTEIEKARESAKVELEKARQKTKDSLIGAVACTIVIIAVLFFSFLLVKTM